MDQIAQGHERGPQAHLPGLETLQKERSAKAALGCCGRGLAAELDQIASEREAIAVGMKRLVTFA